MTTPPAHRLAARVARMMIVVGSALAATATAARAASDVVVVRPRAPDAFVDEIFHRVGGELTLHGFAVRQQDASDGDDLALAQARALLARTGADACVGFLSRGDASVVRVWVAGKSGAPSLFEAVSLRRTPDAPTILAARAVDLLTAALGQPAAPAEAPVVVAAAPAPQPPPAPPRFALGLGAVLIGRGEGFGAAAGPLLSLEGAVAPRLWLGARLTGPAWGPSQDNADAGASLTQGTALAQAALTIASARALAVRLRAGAGAAWLRASGHVDPAIASLAPNTETRWTFAGALGLELVVAVAARVSLGLAGDVALLLPRPRIEVGRESVRIQQPQPSLALEARFGF